MKIIRALSTINPAEIESRMSAYSPNEDINHTKDAKQKSGCGSMCDGIQVAMSITTIAPEHIVTSYFPLAWNGNFRIDRIAHSRPKTTWMYGTINSADSLALTLSKSEATYQAT
jgi:hypothetical protein